MSVVKLELLRRGWQLKCTLESKAYYILNHVKRYICMEKSSPHKSRDILSDRFLLAYLIYKARARDLGKTKIQKLVYFIESELAERNIKTFDYDFIRSNFGAFSGRVNDDLNELKSCDVVTTRTVYTFRGKHNFFEPTDNGREIIEESDELIAENRDLINDIDAILQKYDRLPLDTILDIAYAKEAEVSGKRIRIKKIRKGTDLNAGVSEADSRNKLKMDDDWRETFCILFDSDECKSHNAGLRDAQEGRFSINEVG
jgi:uncharacterized protein YwgA